MSKIEIGLGALHINASVIAQGLALEPSLVQAMMRKGEITSLCERGVNEDAGRYRLTFFHKSPFSPRRRRDRNRHPAVDCRLRRSTAACVDTQSPLSLLKTRFERIDGAAR
jgi:hypothetical protein